MKLNSKHPPVLRTGYPKSRTLSFAGLWSGHRAILFGLVVSLISTSVSCGPAPAPPSPTSLPPQPTNAEPAITAEGASLLKAGPSYSDALGDMDISFLDVVAFQATVDEEMETLEFVLHMRDIPATAPLGQITNLLEYSWMISVYLDPSEVDLANIDYYFALNTTIAEPYADTIRPIPGTPVSVPIDQLFENESIYNSSGMPVSTPQAIADPASDTLTISGRVPGIKSNAGFSFSMAYYDGTVDRPDNYVPPEFTDVSTPLPAVTPARDATAQLIPAGSVRAYPGPEHYAGDVLTFEIPNDGSFGDETVTVSMTLDDKKPIRVSGTATFLGLVLPSALDTKNLSGPYTLHFTTADGRLNEIYAFDVLPAEERPANEESATWQFHESACCILHYISDTAAARDILFIAEHFQQAAEEFLAITGTNIDPKFTVYIVDRIWGNGGFGGNGEVVMSYTDRYYGPTVGAEGLETLARHEFTHAADVGLAMGDGIDFNYEGLALYVAGGHYKPELFAERGAALFDLGHYVPVGQFIGQHELDYLYPAAMLTYIVETYGEEKMWKLLAADNNPDDGQLGPLEVAIHATFGISLNDFDQGFQAWLESKEPGKQLDDLRLTIELQDLRREYQETYVPPPLFLLGKTSEVADPDYLPLVMREARTPANIATELIIANGQQAIVDGDYPRAAVLSQTLADIVSTGEFENPLAKDYLDIVLAAANEGYEVVNLDIERDRARARVTAEPPVLISLELQKVDGSWQIRP